MHNRSEGLYRRWGKRALDLAIAVPACAALAPVMAIAAVAVRSDMGRPVFFTHMRGGHGGTKFPLLKFRSMTDERDSHGGLLPDAQRLTALGRFLRRSSLDELPSLWNILRGDMSLVGPRPFDARYLARYTPRQAGRHRVKPGLTGWAQINGRNAVSWEQKFELDLWYAERVSLALDLRILVRTAIQVIKGSGVSADGHETAPEFMGSG